METYVITSEPYYDNNSKCYFNILIIDRPPNGPLKSLVKKLTISNLSPFQINNNIKYKCYYAIYDINNNNIPMNSDNYYDLYIYLLNNSYTINAELTNMIDKSTFKSSKNLLCFISYKN